jgi:ADP-heptose:LPS heptosyltransferase
VHASKRSDSCCHLTQNVNLSRHLVGRQLLAQATQHGTPVQLGPGIRHDDENKAVTALLIAPDRNARTANVRLSFAVPPAGAKLSQCLDGLDRSRRLIVVHPGASASSRRYPPELFARAVALLAESGGCEIVFTGDAGEEELVSSVQRKVSHRTRSLVGRLTLAELGALIGEADLLICNNTGPAHIAAALGTPVVDLYALTNPQHTPWEVASRVLYHDVPCRNCYKSVCPAGHHDCLRRVAPERVVEAARELLESR